MFRKQHRPLPPQQLVVVRKHLPPRPSRLYNSAQNRMSLLRTASKPNKLPNKHKLYLLNIANAPRISWPPRCPKNVVNRLFGV